MTTLEYVFTGIWVGVCFLFGVWCGWRNSRKEKDGIPILTNTDKELTDVPNNEFLKNIEWVLNTNWHKWWRGIGKDKKAKQIKEFAQSLYNEARATIHTTDNLVQAASDYEQTRMDVDCSSENEVVRRAFAAGAKWQIEEFVRESIGGTVRRVGINAVVDEDDPKELITALRWCNDGDRVKIIIVKE